ncbi:MAG: peptide chain release factor N(5)-glutamine methyltransferase [Candidatus Promineofilum sp.]|nr:peptide chain release factor N(5)-glutamine methyltransferase [Promineifilum sp.]
MITIRQAWRDGRAQLHRSPSPALDARLLLAHALGRDHAYLVAHDDELLSAEQAAAFAQLLARAAADEPIPYLTGRAPFYGQEFAVAPAVLIPRPETEQLVEVAIGWARRRGRLRVADVGTGSGCIAVTLARHLPAAEVAAVDVSAAALAVARSNAERLAPGRVALVRGDLLAAFGPGLDLIAANLPYVTRQEWTALADGVKSYEPALALDGGTDGLDAIRALLPQAAERLRPGGLVLLEIGWRQGEAAAALARAAFPAARIAVRPDFAGHDRLVVIETEPSQG